MIVSTMGKLQLVYKEFRGHEAKSHFEDLNIPLFLSNLKTNILIISIYPLTKFFTEKL